jgi:DNA polymerase-3 subunit delta'
MWHDIIGHDEIVERFRRALKRGRLASSFLFAGPPGIGKRTFALKFAQALLCENRPDIALDPCEQCPACIRVLAGTHEDLLLVAKPEDKSFIPLELLIGDTEHRRREGLCHFIALKPRPGGRKIAVIDDADYLNAEGANALLKTLEEPPPRSVLILISAGPARQLPTIRSRCQLIRFQPLDAEAMAQILPAREIAADAAEAARLARYSEGSVERAGQLADAELWNFRGALVKHLAAERLDGVSLARLTAKFVEQAGKDAQPRRRRLRQAIAFAADFYRRLLRAANGTPETNGAESDLFIDEALKHPSLDVEKTIARLQRCLDAEEQVDRNANQSTLIEAWLDDLACA